MPDNPAFEAYISDHSDRFTDTLSELVAQPSVSATDHGVDGCTELLASLCKSAGFDETTIVETAGQPSIIAQAFSDHDRSAETSTLLCYGHYDVQPVDPDKWTTPPFEPSIREGPTGEPHMYGRGISDMKAQLLAHICAVEALHETDGLPLDVTLFLEGEEEVGSPHIEDTVRRQRDLLEGDFLYHPDGEMWGPEQPHLLLGDRGLVLGQIDVTAANRDLHSGHFGGPVPNAAWTLIQLCGTMIDAEGTVTIQGFYDDVIGVSNQDRDVLEELAFDESSIKEQLGLQGFAPCKGDSYLESIMYYPQLNFSGFSAGYGGEGNKNIVPSNAQVKFDVRLVPDQEPDRVFDAIVKHVADHGSDIVDFTVTRLDRGGRQNRASETPLDSPYIPPVADAIERVWGTPPNVYQRSGASGPIDVFERHLGVPHICAPYGSPGSGRHGPDENMAIRYFTQGIRTSAHVMANVANAG